MDPGRVFRDVEHLSLTHSVTLNLKSALSVFVSSLGTRLIRKLPIDGFMKEERFYIQIGNQSYGSVPFTPIKYIKEQLKTSFKGASVNM